MPIYRFGSRYSRWDGTQQIGPLSADDLMRAMSDDLMQDGDVNRAMQRLFRWGFQRPDGENVPGLQGLMQRLRDRRQEQLERYDLQSMLSDIADRIEQIVETERQGIAKRLDETQEGPRDGDVAAGQQEEDGAQPSAKRGDSAGQSGTSNEAGQSREQGAADAGADGESGATANPDLRKLLEAMAQRRLQQLDSLPKDPAAAIRALTDYDFMTPEARQQFQELLDMLQQQMTQQTFQGMQQALSQMTPEDIGEMRQMMQELNEMLEARQRGEDPGFQEFMHRWGHFFGPGLNSLDDLMERMQQQMGAMRQLMQSMSADQRGELQGLMQAAMQDEGLRQEMNRLGENLGSLIPPEQWRRGYQFSGDESLTLEQAMRLMDRLGEYDELESQFRDVRDWNDLAGLDDDKIRDLLGEEEGEQLEQLRQIARMLEEAGYIRQTRRGYELTPQGVRKIGEKALTDIFADLKRDQVGQHDLRREGGAGDRTDVTKAYEFGDPFLLDIPKTIMNAVQRGEGPSADAPGVRLSPRDFEVYRTEYTTRSATVLMVDMSRSMLYNGCFNAAKRVALALDSLIRGKYPRDHLSIIGFSYLAQEIKPGDLPSIDWNEYNYGTNMQHGFQLARQILGRQKGANRQIIVITDGEPTAHFDNGHVRFSYPPTPRTFQETLREVVRCTRDGITINTFMLERSPYMVQFINDLMRINTGRVFVATPDRLGEYILVDYVANKRKFVA
ncbi:MAG: VWA domain-containing protein [Chloroflexi bacterium]|nr:VWA domain-containing protein [Chloroflexota bacterium]